MRQPEHAADAVTQRRNVILIVGALIAFAFVAYWSGHLAAEQSGRDLRAYADAQAHKAEVADYNVCLDRRLRTVKANADREAQRRNWLIAAAARQAQHDLGVAEAYRQNADTLTPSPLPACGPHP